MAGQQSPRASLSLLTLCLSLLLLFTSAASAASSVLGIDFGTLNIKAVLVKPGIPFEIVLSKDSKRKETAALGFKPNRDSKNKILTEVGTFPERIYGGDALALQGRFPGEVYPNLKALVGITKSQSVDAHTAYKSRYPAAQVSFEEELGTSVFTSGAFVESEASWTVEELLAMELRNVRANAESLAKGNVVDAVITVPAYYTLQERRAIRVAADLAGLWVSALISDGLAVGLDYAKTRTFPEVTKGGKPEHHIVYDMGAGSTSATLLRFQSRSVKDIGRFNKTVQEISVLGTGWDRKLGGDALNDIVLNKFIADFSEKSDVKAAGKSIDDIKGAGRLMSRLWKDAEKARQVLSANTEVTSSFEELLPDISFRQKLTRAEFEELAAPFAARVTTPISDALSAAKLTLDDIDSIILHGGAIRTPFVHKALEKFAGAAKLKTNVNSDESAVFGAAFRGAELSPSFKVKDIRTSDLAAYAAGITYLENGKTRRQGLFTPLSVVGNGGSTKQVTFKSKEDFTLDFFQVVDGVDYVYSTFKSRNLTDSVKALNSKFGCEKDQISTVFGIRINPVNGLQEVVSGSVSCEVDGSVKAGSVGDSVKDWLGLGKKKDQEVLAEGDEQSTSESVKSSSSSSSTKSSKSKSSSSSSSSSAAAKASAKPKKRTEVIPIAFNTTTQEDSEATTAEIAQMKERLAAFDRSDKARASREEAVNVLEGYTYYVRDFLTNDAFSDFTIPTQIDEIKTLLESTREFMESSDFVKSTEAVLREKYQGLKDLITPITSRKEEEGGRETKLKVLKDSMQQMKTLMDNVKEQIAEASAAASKAAESLASQATASEGESPSASTSTSTDELADLEESATSSSTTAEATPVTSGFAGLSAYTEEDFTSIKTVYDAVTEWLTERESEQSKLQSYENPVLLVKDIEEQATKLSKAMTNLIYRKIKFPSASSSSSTKKARTTKTKSASTAKKSKKASSSVAAPPSDASPDAGQKPIVTVKTGDAMPTEEEILKMMEEADVAREHEEL